MAHQYEFTATFANRLTADQRGDLVAVLNDAIHDLAADDPEFELNEDIQFSAGPTRVGL